MLDIISMIILLFVLIGLPIILIIIGGSTNKTEEEKKLEDEEQLNYLSNYRKEKKLEVKK